MAKFLIRTLDGENAKRYMRGDIVNVYPDAHVFGRMESLKVWTDEGNPAILWPGGFLILELVGLSEAQARTYLIRTSNRRSEYNIDISAILSVLPRAKLDTYSAECRMTFNWSNAAVRAYFKAKP